MNVYGIIMAGGGGERFWPLSRQETPKQLLNLTGKGIMVNEAIDRLARVAARENIYIVTNEHQAQNMRAAVCPGIDETHILAEPAARNTVACIGYAAMQIAHIYGDGIMVITPSDAYIRDEKKFADVLHRAVSAAENTDKLVTVGITPTFPATGYGYIRFEKSESAVKQVVRFVEKPSLRRAKKYLASGEYVWNSGMFIWKASVILEQYKKHLPEVYGILEKIGNAMGTPEEKATLDALYPQIPSVSVDIGIMEKAAKDILVVPGEFGWSDVGSWDMLSALHGADSDGNVVVGDHVGEGTKNTVVYSQNKLVATVGLTDMIVVDTPDAILVCPKSRAQDVKKIVEALKQKGRSELL